MTIVQDCPLAAVVSSQLRESRNELTARWLERISARVAVDANRIFPTDELLNHVPLLVDGIAAYIENPSVSVTADMQVIDKARELGALRHAQGFDQFEILKEFEILGNILLSFVGRVADASSEPCTRSELISCAQRVFQAVQLIQQATSTQYMQLLAVQVSEREQRLRTFNRALTHEFRNRIGATLGAAQVLELDGLPVSKQRELTAVVSRNTIAMQDTLENLLELSRVEDDPRRHRNVWLREAALEAARQLREMAAANDVVVRVDDAMPAVEVNAAAVELCLTNLISNAIKYAAPERDDRWVEVRGRMASSDDSEIVVIEVADNGRGVPAHQRDRLFERFFRADNALSSEVTGTGIGLSIVQETITSLGGTVWAEFPDEGLVVCFSLPSRRSSDNSKQT